MMNYIKNRIVAQRPGHNRSARKPSVIAGVAVGGAGDSHEYTLCGSKAMGDHDLACKPLEDLQKFVSLSTRFPKTNIVVAWSITLLDS